MFHNSPLSHLKCGKEMKHFYSAAGIWSFGQGLVQIFIPIFLIVSGFDLGQVFLFSLLAQLVRAINIPFSVWASERYGAKHVLSFSFIFPVLFFISLSFAKGSMLFFYLAALFFGLKMAYLFIPYHLHLSKISPDNRRGRILASTAIIAAFSAGAAPIIGGFLIGDRGMLTTAMFASVFFIISAVILLVTKETTAYHSFKLRRLPLKKVYGDALASGFYNVSSQIGAVVWAIFVFVALKTYSMVGLVGGISLALGVSLVYFLGGLEDRSNRKKVFFWTSVAFAVFAIPRAFLGSFSGVVVGNILYSLTAVATAIAWTSIFHTNLNKNPKAEYLFWMEFAGAVLSAVFMGVFMGIYLLSGMEATLVYGIIISGISMLFVNFVRLKK